MNKNPTADFSLPNQQHKPEAIGMPELTNWLISNLETVITNEKAGKAEATLEVESEKEVLSLAYESLRNSLEYTEEHLVMRVAVARYLRRTFLRIPDNAALVEELIAELTRSGYVKDLRIKQTVVDRMVENMNAYGLMAQTLNMRREGKDFEELVGMISSHIQDILVNNQRAPIVTHFIHTHLMSRFDSPSENTDIPMYIAVERVLLKSDNETITSRLFQRYYGPYLTGSPEAVAGHYHEFLQTISAAMRSEDLIDATAFARRESAPLLVLINVLDRTDEPRKILHTNSLSARVQGSSEDLYSKASERLKRAILRSVIFLMITKALIGLSIEIPYDLYTHDEILWIPLLINLSFPPLYLLLISSTLRPPGQSNTDAVRKHLHEVLLNPGSLSRSATTAGVSRSSGSNLFNFIYLIVSGLIIYGLVQLLYSLEFNIVSIVVFLIYFSSVSFFSYRIGNHIRELKVYNQRRGGLLDTIISILTTPFVRTGQWLSARYQGINVFVFIFDFLIEAPFKSIASVYRRWTAFLREKQDETL